MSKKLTDKTILILSVIILIISMDLSAFATTNFRENGLSLTNFYYTNGYIFIEGTSKVDMLRLLILKKGGENWYDVDIRNGYFKKSFILNSDSGQYDIFLMIHTGSYNFTFGPQIKVILKDDTRNLEEQKDDTIDYNEGTSNSTKIFNSSLLNINRSFNSSYKYIALNITKNSYNDYSKAISIYKWVSKNIRYDRNKYMKLLKNDYSDEYGAAIALRTGKGVCYDFAALVSQLGKEVGLEIRMAKGDYSPDNSISLYHAWNEVYIKEQSRWISMDTTFASVYGRNYFDTKEFRSFYSKTEEE